ncbi:MAG: TonB-dependent receptor, partial [Mediterranea sp.]|nr:TonB-dependent receptor [Mediterranea sp.]
DIDGNFAINVSANATLDISFIGYITESVKVTGSQPVQVALKEDAQSLEEVVVVGYGVQKKKLITGATVQVTGEGLQKMSKTSGLASLQGQAAGVNITQSSGAPGQGFKVNIRGVGTIGNSAPLYVIDGLSQGNNSSNFQNLNPSDIESIDVLKDAASAAIYGSQAANGVILITTKQGKAGKMQLSYDGFTGIQNPLKLPAALNAKDYILMENEMAFNDNGGMYIKPEMLPAGWYEGFLNETRQGTDWIDLFKNTNAPIHNHSISLAGGSDVSKFNLGFSYSDQEGILGNPAPPQSTRHTLRVNSEHTILKGKGFDIIKVGENLSYNHRESTGLSSFDGRGNALQSMIRATPLLPIYDAEGNYYDREDKRADGFDIGTSANPIGQLATGQAMNQISKNYGLRVDLFAEIQPIKKLIFRTVFGYKMSASSWRGYQMVGSWSETATTSDRVNQNASSGWDWSWDSTLSYAWNIQSHNFDAVLGTTIGKWGYGENINGYNGPSLFPGLFDYAWLNNVTNRDGTVMNTGSSPWGEGASQSFFGRVNYNYNEKYLLTMILRTDGSSNFARGHRWGYFPSISAGWVLTNESFMESTSNWLDFLKLRGSWGQNGNANIDAFQYLATIAMSAQYGYYFGDKNNMTTGAVPDILPNENVKWETSEQLDLGIDSRFLRSRLGVTFDYYVKTTKDWLVRAPMLLSFGTNAPYKNGGDIQNKGIELGITWNDHIGKDFSYGANFNISYNKNEVLRIDNGEGIIEGSSNILSQSTAPMYRAQVGYPIGYFYGYKTDGVFQNYAQVNTTKAKVADAQPGDLIFVDTNGDNEITSDDRTIIGNPNPDFIGGLSFNLGYKGFDFMVSTTGAFGMQVAKSYRDFGDSNYHNFSEDIFDRWHGEGTSNKLPRLTTGSHANWTNISDIYIEDADYVKIQNITVGYDFKKLFTKLPFSQARLYVSAQNLYTFTGYSGVDPEVGYAQDGWARGIDVGFYPAARTYLVGANIKF